MNNAAQGLDAGVETPAALCAGMAASPQTLTLALPRARATVSPVQARGVLQAGKAPPAALIQAGEMLDYYRPSYHVTAPLGVQAGLAQGPIESELLLQIGVQAPGTPVRGSKSVVTAVVDTSISMVGGGMESARAAVVAMLAALHQGDTLNLVTSNTGVAARTFSLDGPKDAAATEAIDALGVDGGEDLGGGLVNGYVIANETIAKGGLNRVVLVTAGSAPRGTIDLGLIAAQASASGLKLVGVGVGPAIDYDDTLLAGATEASHGADVYLDGPAEADVMLHQRFDEVMDIAASAVQIQVTLPGWLMVESTGAATSTDSADGGSGALATPDLGPGRPMIFRMTLYPCTTIDPTDVVKVAVSYTSVSGGAEAPAPVSYTVGALLQQTPAQIAKASAVVAYADALTALDAARVAYAQQLAASEAFDADPDFADPKNGIRALLGLEQGFVQ